MIVILNPNSTATMTKAMLSTARTACPGEEIEAWTSHEGPAAIEGPEDGAACVAPLLGLVRRASNTGARTIIIGCADDTGLDEARAIAACPVIGIGQAGYTLAALAGRFSVVTTLAVSVPVLTANIAASGFSGHLGRVRASGVAVLEFETFRAAASATVLDEIRRAQVEDGVRSVVLGCAGMAHIPAMAGPEITVRLIDGVAAATRLAAILCLHPAGKETPWPPG